MADDRQNFNTLSVEDAGAVKIGKKVNECDNNNMFNDNYLSNILYLYNIL